MKRCSTCKQLKLPSEFNRNRCSTSGLQSVCRVCSSIRSKKYYVDNNIKHRRVASQRSKIIFNELKKKVFGYLMEHPCVDCDEKNLLVLDFDHVRGVKVNAVSNLVRRRSAWLRVKAEIAKCEVRCANCHRKRTAQNNGARNLLIELGFPV